MQDHEDKSIWQELIALTNEFISTGIDKKIDAALQIFNRLFSFIMDHLIKFKADLANTFGQLLQHKSLDIKLAALQAVSNLLSTAERKDCKDFTPLIPYMCKVINESILENNLIRLSLSISEFNELAEIEPNLFKEIYGQLK